MGGLGESLLGREKQRSCPELRMSIYLYSLFFSAKKLEPQWEMGHHCVM